jgi:hypothetical protein
MMPVKAAWMKLSAWSDYGRRWGRLRGEPVVHEAKAMFEFGICAPGVSQ